MNRLKKLGIILFVIVLIGMSFLNKGLNLYVDWLWFNEVCFQHIFSKTLLTKIELGIIVGFAFFVLLWLNLLIVKQVIKNGNSRVWRIGGNLFEIPNKELIQPYINLILLTGSLFFAFLSGNGAAAKWMDYLKFINPSSFGILDPLFSKDIGFYVFQLPFLSFFYYLCLFWLILTIIVITVLYIFEEAIYITRRGVAIVKNAKAHLSILGAIFCVFLFAGCWINIYNLLYSSQGVVFGASYTDIHANLPVLKIVSIMCLLSGAILLLNLFIHKIKWVFIIIGATAVIWFVGLKGYTGIVQKFQVAPNEITMEQEYIKSNINFTRIAYGLDNIKINEFPAKENLDSKDIANNSATIKNIRLWDHAPLLATYGQLQEIRTYYKFVDVDNDRYVINGEYQQVMLSPRELSYEHLPSKIWINEHLTYTHGYGICLGPVNRISAEGLPEFMIKDIPPINITDLKLTKPEIYYGEIGNDYCFVNTKSKEFDYPSGDKNVYTTYNGKGGIVINSIWRKILLAIKFKEIKILFSNEITNQSRIMLYRNISERMKILTPFITYDSDPYLVLSEGRLYWICDGYTITDMYPYSEPIAGVGNYIRNSVKAVVDAYNGNIQFYVSDKNDPLIQTYTKIFPDLFLPLKNLSDDLKRHLRYPIDLLTVQARMYSIYHMQDTQVFYNKEDLWTVPKRSSEGMEQYMQPYYTIMKLPGEQKSEFILMIPFIPSKKDNMIAWLAARCDAPNYGKLLVYQFPKKKLVYGPSQINARINQDAEISKQLSLWNQRGSQVIQGSLLAIPIEESLLYVQPLYLAAEKGKIPELKRVIVAFGNRIAMEENLETALDKIFGMEIIEKEAKTKTQEIQEDVDTVTTKELIRQASESFEKAQAYMRQGNWAQYGQQLEELKRVLNELGKR